MAERNFSGIQRRRGGCPRELSGEDTKLELEDCSGLGYTMGPLEGSTCWRCVPKLYGKQTLAKQRLPSLAVGISLTQLSSRPCVCSFLAELTSELPPGPSSPVLPTLGHIHVPGMSQAFRLSPPTKAISDLVELTVSDLEDINMHSPQEGPSHWIRSRVAHVSRDLQS